MATKTIGLVFGFHGSCQIPIFPGFQGIGHPEDKVTHRQLGSKLLTLDWKLQQKLHRKTVLD